MLADAVSDLQQAFRRGLVVVTTLSLALTRWKAAWGLSVVVVGKGSCTDLLLLLPIEQCTKDIQLLAKALACRMKAGAGQDMLMVVMRKGGGRDGWRERALWLDRRAWLDKDR